MSGLKKFRPVKTFRNSELVFMTYEGKFNLKWNYYARNLSKMAKLSGSVDIFLFSEDLT